MAGVPIRLVRRDGQLLNLDCTDYQVSLTRSVVVAPVPITAERFGADLNMVQAEIILECLLTDDDCTSTDYGKSYAGATIDFSYRRDKEDDDNTALSPWLTGDNGTVTAANLDDAVFTFISTDETDFTLTLKNGSATTSGNAMQVDISSATTAVTMTSAIKTVLDANSTFLSKFTITAGVGANENITTTSNTKLVFTQRNGGSSGTTGTPTFDAPNVDYDPHISVFSDVEDTGCRSAGDKAQNIMATVGNNSILGVMGKVGDFGGGGLNFGNERLVYGDSADSDYIVGLQLPYNSLAQASLSNVGDPVAGYNVRNFLLVTGGHMAANLKDASGNDKDASIDFVFNDKKTGISGTIKAANIKYDAGSTIYRATLTFQPLDVIGAL